MVTTIQTGKAIINSGIRQIKTSSSYIRRSYISHVNNWRITNASQNPYVKEFYTQVEGASQKGTFGKATCLVNALGRIVESPIILKRKLHQLKLKTGNYNKNPITFEPANTIKEAIQFGQKHGFYNKIKNAENTDIVLKNINTLNEGLTNVHNKTNGKSIMVRNVSVENLAPRAGYRKILDELIIPNNKVLAIETVYHEMGHVNHAININLHKIGKMKEMAENGKNASITLQFLHNTSLIKLIREHMRNLSTESPAEFVADRFRYAMMGIKMPKEINLAYDALKGPDIIKHLF